MKRNSVVTPVVFVHGAFCGGWAFDGFRQPFEAAGLETHAPNLPHHERGADLEQLAQQGLKDYAHARPAAKSIPRPVPASAGTDLLLSTDRSIREIAAATGFRDPFYLSRAFRKAAGVSPSAYRKARGSTELP